jgi:hypothetical protein
MARKQAISKTINKKGSNTSVLARLLKTPLVCLGEKVKATRQNSDTARLNIISKQSLFCFFQNIICFPIEFEIRLRIVASRSEFPRKWLWKQGTVPYRTIAGWQMYSTALLKSTVLFWYSMSVCHMRNP